MKRYLSLFVALVCVAMCAFSAQKIYINPGHGSFTGDSRPMGTIAYPLKSNGLPDTLGFYESNTNLWKSLYLQKKLSGTGKYSIKMSRTKNGGSQNGTYNKPLSTIATEAANWGGYFISIHSNAATEGTTTNYLLLIHRGYNNSATNSGSIPFEKAIWKRMFKINTAGFEYNSHYSLDNMNIRGGLSMNGWDYGVLRHSRPGTLSEGYFHTYQPARHRALNPDWCCQEGVRYFRGIQDYFGFGKESVGYIMGAVRTKEKSLNQTYYKSSGSAGNDKYAPINGAKIVLRDADNNVIKTNCYPYVKRMKTNQDYYTTDGNYNGVFVFENLKPGKYTIYVHASGYKDYVQELTVTADETTYTNVFMTSGQGTQPNTSVKDPDIIWELNGGIVPGGSVPTNAELWAAFMPYYNTYYGLSRATQDITAVATFANAKMQDIMTNSKSEYKWLGDYILSVAGSISDESGWRWNVHAFFNCNNGQITGNQKAAAADFSTAGKPAAWGDAYRVAHGTSAELPTEVTSTYTLPTPIKEGYKFVGWFNNNAGTGTALTTIPANYKGTLYAIWTLKDPDVIWELNGGKVAEAVKVPTNDSLWNAFKPYYNKYYGLSRADQPITAVATFANAQMQDIMTNSKSEYKWLGDYIATAALGLGVELENDETKWRWHVHCFFNCNDGTIQGDQKVATADFTEVGKPESWGPAYQAKYGAGVTLPQFITATYALPTPTKDGHIFKGWYNNAEGTGEALVSLPVGYKGTVYAIWMTAGDIDVNWVLNGGKVNSTLPIKITEDYTIPTPTRDGYAFIGWYDNAAGTGNKLTVLPAGYKGTVYAVWVEAIVTWVLNGGKVLEEVTVPDNTVKVPTQEELWASFKTAAGLTTLGTLAEITEAGAGKPHTDGNNQCACRIICGKLDGTMVNTVLGQAEWIWLRDYIMTVQTTLTVDDIASNAAWRYAVAAFFLQSEHSAWPASANFATAGKPEAWGPAYQKANGGTGGSTTTTQEVQLPTRITSEYTIPTPVRDGVTFIGWYDNPEGAGTALVKLPVNYYGTVYAIWSDNVVDSDVVWVLNGGNIYEQLPSTITAEYTTPTPSKLGYVFLGWNTKADGTGDFMTVLPVGYKGTLYAIWREAKVTWVLNGGQVLGEEVSTDVTVPTEEEIWAKFKTAASIDGDMEALGTLAELRALADPYTTFCGNSYFIQANVEQVFGNAEWAWLRDYIASVQNAQKGNPIPDNFTGAGVQRTVAELYTDSVSNQAVFWRYATASFFLQSQHKGYPGSADFSTAGKPEAWADAYKKAHGATTTPGGPITLPTSIVGSDYLIPTPTKENDTFIGWYDNNDGLGTALTVLPVGYDGTVYAIWKSMGTATGVEEVRPALDIYAPMYDIMGRQVDESYRGIIIQNGHKYLLR